MKVEVRNNSVHLDGYVNVHSRDSRELNSPRGRFVEQISPKVFDAALHKRAEVDLLFNHREDRKLGGTVDGNLQLFEDSIGLRAICTVTDEEVVAKARNNELRGWSFGFVATEQRWSDGDNGVQRRYVDGLDLIEVSILDVTPAYYATTIEARGEDTMVERRMEDQTIELVLDDAPGVENNEQEVVAPDYTVVETQVLIDKLKGGL